MSHDAHASMAIRAFSAGKHVLLEKPMARTLEEAQAIVEAAERSGLRLMIAENYHFGGTFNELYRRLPSVGRPHTVIVGDTHYNQSRG